MESRFKILITLIITFNILILGCFYTLVNSTHSAQYLFEKTTHAHYMRKVRNIDGNSIVFLGSSSIQGFDVSQIAGHSINLGIGGERLSGLISRVLEYQQLPQSRLIVIAAGFNDICHSKTLAMSKSFDLLLQQISGVPIVISALQPATNLKLCENLATKIIQFNQYLRSTCNNMQNCYFVDLPRILSNQKRAVFESDGIHLNRLGYQLWKTKLSNTIKYALTTTKGINSIL
jgi:lysophospholipase L1-like esterase